MKSLYSYSKEYRMLKASDFTNLRVSSKRKRLSSFIVIYKSNQISNARLGIAVSKKYGNAIFRNKIKRIVREFFRTSDLKNLSYDFLFIYSSSANVSSIDFKNEFVPLVKSLC